jgi:hypothetical protein
MTSPAKSTIIQPIAGDETLVARLRELHLATWPANLDRFRPFSLVGESANVAHIAVAWDPLAGSICSANHFGREATGLSTARTHQR